MTGGLARSIQTRIVRHAHAQGLDPNVVFARYGAERFLHRLARSRHAERFVLKGALMLIVWLGETLRPTRDADLLGLLELDEASLRAIVAEICLLEVEPDGLAFDASSVRVSRIRQDQPYGGLRAALFAQLGKARLRIQVDVGFGDLVIPEPEWIEFPSLLDLPRPHLRAYRPETTIAEKLHAMVELGSRNSRLRDYFDIHALAERGNFDGAVLASAVAATFTRRRTEIPCELPFALTKEFALLQDKRAQWNGFVRRLPDAKVTPDLDVVLAAVVAFVSPVLIATGRGESFQGSWQPGGPWR